MEISLEKVAAIFLAFVGTILLVVIIWNITNPTKSGLLSFLSFDEQNKTNLVEIGGDIPFYNEFVKNYQECKLSPSTQCFCSLTFPEIPSNYLLEIDNDPQSKKTALRLYSNVEILDCKNINPLSEAKDINTTQKIIENDLIYFKNVRTTPDVIIQGDEQFGKFVESDFIQIEKLYLQGTNLCSTKDVKWFDDISFKNGFLYKFDQERTAFSSGTVRLQRCNTVPNIVQAYDEFNSFILKINECKSGTCSHPVSIPENFEISIENNKVILKYKNTELRSSEEITKQLCTFTHFRPDLRQEQQLTTLKLNDYLQVDIYPSESKVCFLPYDDVLVREKQVAISRDIINEPIVPAT